MRKGYLYEISPPPYNKLKIPKRPLILLLGKYDWANVGYNLMVAINRHTNWNARCIIDNEHPFHFPYDILAVPVNSLKIRSLLDNADFILYISSFFGTSPVGIIPNRKTPSAIWHGGSYFRNKYKMFIEKIHRRYKFVFAHRDLENICKGIIRLQAPYDTEKYGYVERNWRGKIIVGHSPSKKSVKGTDIFLIASEELQRLFGKKIGFRVIEGDWKTVIRKKRNIHIFFDQINESYDFNILGGGSSNHGYGVSLVECASHGSICMAGCKYPDTPIISVRTSADIVKNISALMRNRKRMEKLSVKTREWVVRDHGYENIAKQFISKIEPFYQKKDNLINVSNVINKMDAGKRGVVIKGRIRLYDFTRGHPSEGYLNVAFIRDIPIMQLKYQRSDWKNRQKSDQLKALRTHSFITLNDTLANTIKEQIFSSNKEVKYNIFKVYPKEKDVIYPRKYRREEILYLDNSAVSHHNYGTICQILEDIGNKTGIKSIFISTNFQEVVSRLVENYNNIRTAPLKDYRFSAKYGILIDAMDPAYASFAIPRKFMVYIASGMIPIIHTNFKESINYVEKEEINYFSYGDPGDINKINRKMNANQNGTDYTIESRYTELLDILKAIDEEYGD